MRCREHLPTILRLGDFLNVDVFLVFQYAFLNVLPLQVSGHRNSNKVLYSLTKWRKLDYHITWMFQAEILLFLHLTLKLVLNNCESVDCLSIGIIGWLFSQHRLVTEGGLPGLHQVHGWMCVVSCFPWCTVLLALTWTGCCCIIPDVRILFKGNTGRFQPSQFTSW